MRRMMWVTFAIGLAAFVGLIVWQGVGTIGQAFGHAGWRILWLAPAYLVPMLLAAASWLVLFRPEHRPSASMGVVSTWISISINWLLPVAQVGGEAARVPIVTKRGTPIDPAIASAVVDKTIQAATQAIFAFIGLGLFASSFTGRGVIVGVLVGGVLMGIGAFGFYLAQRRGIFGMVERIVERFVSSEMMDRVPIKADLVDAAVHEMYGRWRAVLASGVLRMAYRFALVGETVLILNLIGVEIGFGDALILESLGQAVRAGAFLIPGGLGAQEGAFVLIGAAVGITGEAGLATSLCKRARELMVGVPALLVWQWAHLRPSPAGPIVPEFDDEGSTSDQS